MFMTSNYSKYIPYINACTLVYIKENSAFYSSTVDTLLEIMMRKLE